MSSRISQLAPPPSSYSPISPSDPNNILGKDNASSTRSKKSSTFSFKHAKGFRRVFGLLGKDSSGSDEMNANTGQNASRLRGGRRDSESGAAARSAILTSTSSPLTHGAHSRIGNDSAPLYRPRNSRSMDALRLFGKSAKTPTPTSKPHIPNNHRPSTSTGSMNTTAGLIILHPNGRDEKDMPVLRLQDEDADDVGNGSTSTESDRSTGAGANPYVASGHQAPSIPIYGGIGGTPPPGAMGAVHLPPSRPPPPLPLSMPTQYEMTSTKAASESTTTNTSEPPTARTRPSKPSLSIPIPPRTSHEKAISASAILPSQSPESVSSAGPPSQPAITPSRTKPPPSPGHGLTFRLTPSIVMSRPVWPLPPLPPMPCDTLPVPSIPTSVSGADGGGLSWNLSNGKSLPMFRLSPPTRSMTGPVPSSSASDFAGDGGASVRRSVSVKLNAMPSLSVMGETEHGDPEADDMMDEDEEEEDMEEEEEVPMGRPSIDSVMSMDSVVSVETVRAPPPPPLSVPSTSNARQIAVGGPIAPADKGKGKAKKERKSLRGDEDAEGSAGSASDSDDSVYFDARDSVFLSPRDVAKELERRASQISQRNSSIRDSRILAMGAGGRSESSTGTGIGKREGLRETSRERRDSSWSFSTAGRESVYLTPSEGSAWSTAATPHGSAIFVTASDLANSGFAKEVSSKRSSVPVGFGATVGGALSGSIGSRRAVGSRFSMVSAAELPSIDSSALNFDASAFVPRTPTPGVPIRGNAVHGGPAPPLPEGLPTTRREGLPNFESAVPVTGKALGGSEVTTPRGRGPRTPKADDYFNARLNYPSSSPSAQRRRGSVSASVSVPAPIAEDAAPMEAESQRISSPVSSVLSSIPTALLQDRPSVIAQPRRPPVYRQASRSMVDVSTSPGMGMDDEEGGEIDHKVDSSVISGPPVLTSSSPIVSRSTANHVDPMAWLVPPPSPSITRPPARRQSTIRRVSSVPLLQSGDMPITVVEKPPPAYHAIPRREEEGKEILPRYYNDITLAGLLHRKMEFDRPGLQARDRSWKKVWCVLQGTGFRVYKVGTLEAKFGALAAVPVAGSLPPTTATTVLGGGRVRNSSFGVSSIAGRRSSNATPPVSAANGAEQSGSGEKPPLNMAGAVLTKNQQRATSPSLLLAPPAAGLSGSPTSSSNSATSRNSGSSHAPSRASFSSSRPTTPSRPATGSLATSPSQNAGFRSRAQEVPLGHGPGGRSVIDNGGLEIYTPMRSALLRQYSLQSGESGLATDYMKRKNVVRVRLEGEQFLLQMPGVEEVVEWIEGFQAAANVALDLDVRPMPKGPLYPRRRRRRRPREPGEPATQSPLSPPPNPGASGTTTPRSSASQTILSSVPSS